MNENIKHIYACLRAAACHDIDAALLIRKPRHIAMAEAYDTRAMARASARYPSHFARKPGKDSVFVPHPLGYTVADAIDDLTLVDDDDVEYWLTQKTQFNVSLGGEITCSALGVQHSDVLNRAFPSIMKLIAEYPREVARGEKFYTVDGVDRVRVDVSPNWKAAREGNLVFSIDSASFTNLSAHTLPGQGTDALLAQFMSDENFVSAVGGTINVGTPKYAKLPPWRRPFYGILSKSPLRSGGEIRRLERRTSKVIQTSEEINNKQAGWLVAQLFREVKFVEASRVWREYDLAIPRVDVTAYIMDVIESIDPLLEAQVELDNILTDNPDEAIKKQVGSRQSDINLGYASILLAANGLSEYRGAIEKIEKSLERRDKLNIAIHRAEVSQARALELEQWDAKFADVVYGDSQRLADNRGVLSDLTDQLNDIAENLKEQNNYIAELVAGGKLPVTRG